MVSGRRSARHRGWEVAGRSGAVVACSSPMIGAAAAVRRHRALRRPGPRRGAPGGRRPASERGPGAVRASYRQQRPAGGHGMCRPAAPASVDRSPRQTRRTGCRAARRNCRRGGPVRGRRAGRRRHPPPTTATTAAGSPAPPTRTRAPGDPSRREPRQPPRAGAALARRHPVGHARERAEAQDFGDRVSYGRAPMAPPRRSGVADRTRPWGRCGRRSATERPLGHVTAPVLALRGPCAGRSRRPGTGARPRAPPLQQPSARRVTGEDKIPGRGPDRDPGRDSGRPPHGPPGQTACIRTVAVPSEVPHSERIV